METSPATTTRLMPIGGSPGRGRGALPRSTAGDPTTAATGESWREGKGARRISAVTAARLERRLPADPRCGGS
jgi:hypothetical protein